MNIRVWSGLQQGAAGGGGRRQIKGAPRGSGLAVGSSESPKVSEPGSDTSRKRFHRLYGARQSPKERTEGIKGLATGLWRETTERGLER